MLRYSLGPIPQALATADGQLAKTQKSKLLDAQDKDVAPAEAVPTNAVRIIDVMAVLQSISSAPRRPRADGVHYRDTVFQWT